jgi:DNA-directed RNA polymerase specialized sigma subunit
MAQDLDDDLEAPAAQTQEVATGAVETWITHLPLRLRDIYQHLYADERSQREAAHLMRLSQPRVAQLHRQLLKRGREELAHLAA